MAGGNHIYIKTDDSSRDSYWNKLKDILSESDVQFVMSQVYQGDWILIQLNSLYDVMKLLEEFRTEFSQNIYAFCTENIVDGFAYWHFQKNKLVRFFDFGLIEAEERSWGQIKGTEEDWEEKIFFSQDQKKSDLDLFGNNDAEREKILSIHNEKKLISGELYPFLGSLEALQIPEILNFPGAISSIQWDRSISKAKPKTQAKQLLVLLGTVLLIVVFFKLITRKNKENIHEETYQPKVELRELNEDRKSHLTELVLSWLDFDSLKTDAIITRLEEVEKLDVDEKMFLGEWHFKIISKRISDNYVKSVKDQLPLEISPLAKIDSLYYSNEKVHFNVIFATSQQELKNGQNGSYFIQKQIETFHYRLDKKMDFSTLRAKNVGIKLHYFSKDNIEFLVVDMTKEPQLFL